MPSVSTTESESPLGVSPPPEAMSVRDLIYIVLRRRNLIISCILAGLFLGLLAVVVTKRMYQAQATIELLKQPNGGALASMGAPGAIPVDSLDFNLTLQTQVNLLMSNAIAMRVISELNLEQADPEFRYHSLFEPLDSQEASGPLTSSRRRQANVLKVFKKHLRVDPVGGTRMIAISYEDPNPEMAAGIVNRVLQDFVDYNFDVQYHSTSQANDWLGSQLSGMKAEVERSREAVAALQKKTGIYGPDETHNVITSRMEQVNTELVNADATLVMKEAIARAAASGNPDLVAGLVSTGANTGGMSTTLLLLQNMREQESQAKAALSELTAKFGPNYPRVVEARERLATIENTSAAETTKMRERATAEYQIAKSVRDSAQRALDAQKQEAAALNDRAVDYSLAKREADSKDALYQQLLGKLTEAQAFAGLRASNINVIDKANVPVKPSKPVAWLYIGAFVFAATILGALLALILDTLDGSLRDPDAVERITGAPLLGLVPSGSRKAEFTRTDGSAQQDGPNRFYEAVALKSDGRIDESFRSIRSQLLKRSQGAQARVIAVTSPSPGEGKVFTVLNLASVLAQAGQKVLVVDADLRRGKISNYLGMDDSPTGVSTIGSSAGKADPTKQWPLVPGVVVMPRGPHTSDLAEVTSSTEMAALLDRYKADFDFILVNTPPLLPVVDALAISRLADLTIIVLRFGKTTTTALNQCLRRLSENAGGRFGFVFNAMDPKGPDFINRAGKEEYAYVKR